MYSPLFQSSINYKNEYILMATNINSGFENDSNIESKHLIEKIQQYHNLFFKILEELTDLLATLETEKILLEQKTQSIKQKYLDIFKTHELINVIASTDILEQEFNEILNFYYNVLLKGLYEIREDINLVFKEF